MGNRCGQQRASVIGNGALPDIIATYFTAIGGLFALLIGGDVLVRGAVNLAERLGVQPLVIGLTVVAFGTSAPELVVCLDAALTGVPDVAMGNVVGSNIANILLVIGVPAVIAPIACCGESVRRDGLLMLAVTAGFIAMSCTGIVDFWHGLVMVALLGGFLYWSYLRARAGNNSPAAAIVDDIEGISSTPKTLGIAVGFIIGGLIGVISGAHLLIAGAVAIAQSFGISDAVIGLTLVALGTSLPELATAIVATLRKHGDVAIGNIIGSNLFNLLGIMGATAMVTPIPVSAQFVFFDYWVMLAAALALMPFVWFRLAISRRIGFLFSGAYAVYVWALFQGMSAMSVPMHS